MRPHILFSGGLVESPSGSFFTSTPSTYAEAVWAVGGLPVLALSVGHRELAESYDGLLLTGGVDPAPSYYGEEPLDASVQIDPKRDELEKALIFAFWQQKKPILGICRGIQVLNVFFGGDLWQDLPTQCNIDHGRTVHTVSVPPGSFLYEDFGGEMRVNSFHHQAVRRVAPDFTVAATSSDGVVEAIERGNVRAVQWHPERMTGALAQDDLRDQRPIFTRFVADCLTGRDQRGGSSVAW